MYKKRNESWCNVKLNSDYTMACDITHVSELAGWPNTNEGA